MFAVALTLVILISTAVLLYQYWAGSLLVDDGDSTNDMPVRPDVIAPATTLHIDNAA
jgi:hypothetical protein